MIIDELLKKDPSLQIVKTYPDSGQKWVYLVQSEKYGLVILKIIKDMNERTQREIDIVNNNDIPLVPKIKELSSLSVAGTTYWYLYEEYIAGETLINILKQGPLNISEAIHLIENLLTIVATLETLRIVHRDIKPANIIRAADGDFSLIDFGIARNLNLPSLTLTEAQIGPHTPGYAAPELFQYSKATISSKADLFSIGIVAYESIFGTHPFITGKEVCVDEIWYRTNTVIPKAKAIPGDTDGQLMGLILTLMQKHVSKRPPSAQKALEWFKTVLKTLSI